MASKACTKEIVKKFPPFIYIYNDGTIERPHDQVRVPPSREDPVTGVSSKDIVFSENPRLLARIFLPKLTNQKEKLSILVFFHGGAFVCESAFAFHHHNYCKLLSSKANVIVVSVEHRKAPEHYLPAAYDDCWASVKWVASHAIETQTCRPNYTEPWLISHGNFNKIFLGGDSSGATIVHGLVMRAGVEALPSGIKIYGAYLNHPYFWGSKPVGSEPIEGFEKTMTYLIWEFVYPNAPGGIDNPLVNPLADGAPSLGTIGCSKMFISVAGKDHLHLRDRAVLYYEAIKASGWKGEVELFEEKEEDHVYYMFYPETEQAKRLIEHLVEFLRQ